MRKAILLAIVLLSSCVPVQKLGELCNQTTSTAHLVPIRNVDFEAIGGSNLAEPVNHNIDYCSLHFAQSTLAGQEFGKALSTFNDVMGSSVHFTNTPADHKTGIDLVPENPISSILDYIDPAIPVPGNCFNEESTYFLAMCPFDSSDTGLDHFTIGVRGAYFQHFSDPTSSNYPLDMAFLHELAHAVGMNHPRRRDESLRWNQNDTKYISTMQGHLTYLSALDVAYLRHSYRGKMGIHRNYVAGTQTRFPNNDGWFDKKSFFKRNPQTLFIDSEGQLKDCITEAAPIFAVSWFNTGNINGNPERCGANRIFLRKRFDRYRNKKRGITLKLWKIATMPSLSQDQWEGEVYLSEGDASKIDFAAEYDLVFVVNSLESLNEVTHADNEVSYPIEIFSHPNDCPPTFEPSSF